MRRLVGGRLKADFSLYSNLANNGAHIGLIERACLEGVETKRLQDPPKAIHQQGYEIKPGMVGSKRIWSPDYSGPQEHRQGCTGVVVKLYRHCRIPLIIRSPGAHLTLPRATRHLVDSTAPPLGPKSGDNRPSTATFFLAFQREPGACSPMRNNYFDDIQ